MRRLVDIVNIFSYFHTTIYNIIHITISFFKTTSQSPADVHADVHDGERTEYKERRLFVHKTSFDIHITNAGLATPPSYDR